MNNPRISVFKQRNQVILFTNKIKEAPTLIFFTSIGKHKLALSNIKKTTQDPQKDKTPLFTGSTAVSLVTELILVNLLHSLQPDIIIHVRLPFGISAA